MRFPFTTVLATLLTSLAITAVATPTTTSIKSLNPDRSVLQGQSAVNRRAPAPRPASSLPLTNARRLQLGLPLKKPHRKVDKVKRSGTPPTSSVSSRDFFWINHFSNISRHFFCSRLAESIVIFWSTTPILVMYSDTYLPSSTISGSMVTSSQARMARFPWLCHTILGILHLQ